MTLDTKLILDTLNKHFAEQEAKWDRWFTAQDAKWDQRLKSRSGTLAAQVISELPPLAALAPTASPTTTTAAPTISSAAATTMTFSDTTTNKPTRRSTDCPGHDAGVLMSMPTTSPAAIVATTQHISAEGDTTADVTKHTAPTTTLSASLAPTAPTAASTTRPVIDVLKPSSAAPTSTLAPVAPSVEDEAANNSLTRCSTQVRNRDTMLTTSPISADSSLDSIKGSSFECSQVRYITNSAPSYLFGVVLLCMETKVRDRQNVFERLLVQSPVLLEPLPGTMVDKGLWPPPKQHCNNFPPETIQLYFSLWPPFSRDWATVQQSPPWPPPRQLDMQCAGVHLRPTPWPSFGCHTVGQLEKALSHIWHIVQFAKLHRDDRRLLQFGPESFPIPVDIAITTFSTAKTVAARQQRGHQEHNFGSRGLDWRNPAAARRWPSRARNHQLPASKASTSPVMSDSRKVCRRNGQTKIQSRNNQLAAKGILTIGSNQRKRTLLNSLNSEEERTISTMSRTRSPSATRRSRT
ncbi:hypothetical protein PAHAL_4G175600 [Panicum hallii]|uniref:Uncharacterized protein n=1 Tax=Panicum hallii TaxID=206008 RepID=A0A2T8JD79_9POAL|nr:hypothetical protein PAHAL_4G175600 [Panicum hallii]